MPELHSDTQTPAAEEEAEEARSCPPAPETPHALEIPIDSEPPPSPPSSREQLVALRRKRTRQVGGLAVVVWVLAACVFGLALTRPHRHGVAKTNAPKSASRAPSIMAAAAAPKSSPSPLDAFSANAHEELAAIVPADSTPPTTTPAPSHNGQIIPPASASSHRIYVDGKIVSEGTKPFDVPCGDHSVRVGSKGQARWVKVPCGGSLTLE